MVDVGGIGVIIVCCGCSGRGDRVTNANASENVRSPDGLTDDGRVTQAH